jgi:hypothetical protein
MHRTQTAQIITFAVVFWLAPQLHSKSALTLFNRSTMFHFKTYVLIQEAIALLSTNNLILNRIAIAHIVGWVEA